MLLDRRLRIDADSERLRPLRADEARSHLDPDTVMLAYSVASEGTDLFVLTREHPIEVHRLPITAAAIGLQVARFCPLLLPDNEAETSEENRDDSNAEARVNLGRWLFDHLVEPATERLADARRVVILPDGPLHYLPFAA